MRTKQTLVVRAKARDVAESEDREGIFPLERLDHRRLSVNHEHDKCASNIEHEGRGSSDDCPGHITRIMQRVPRDGTQDETIRQTQNGNRLQLMKRSSPLPAHDFGDDEAAVGLARKRINFQE